jgi:hypothetical protein
MKSKIKKVVKHLRGDIKDFKKEASEDRKLIKSLKNEKPEKKKPSKPGHKKFKKVLEEFSEKELHSGSKKGPLVKDKSQALAIAFSEDRKADKAAKKRKSKRK